MLTQAQMAEARPRLGGTALVGPRARNLVVVCRDLGCQPADHFVHQVAQSPKPFVLLPFHAPEKSMDGLAMNTPKPGKDDPMTTTDQAVMRGVLSRNAPKRLARLMSVSVETARCWLYRTLSASRRREIALALIAELDAEDRRRAAYRQHLVDMAGEDGPVAGSLDGTASEQARRAQDRAKIG